MDWCEDHKTEVIRVNVTGTLTLADETSKRGIHMTNFATGCIYSYDEAHPIGGARFTEEDEPNFDGSFYSKTKAVVEKLLREYDNVLTLRVRMPISDDLSPRNFITKITKYAKVRWPVATRCVGTRKRRLRSHVGSRPFRESGRQHPELHDGADGDAAGGFGHDGAWPQGRLQLHEPRASAASPAVHVNRVD